MIDALRFVPYADGSYIDIYSPSGEIRLGHFLLPHDDMNYVFISRPLQIKLIHLEQILEKLKELNNVGKEARPQV